MSFPTPRIDVEFGGTVGTSTYLVLNDTLLGKFDTGTFAPDFVGYEITNDVRGFTISRGRNRLLEAFSAGTATIELDNNSGNYDPNNLSGTFVTAGVSLVRPMVKVRIRAEYGGTAYNLFYGYADAWDVTYPGYGATSTTILRATDGFKVLARIEPGSASEATGGGEYTGTRIGRLLDSASWPTADRDLNTGNSPQQPTTLNQNVLSEMQQAAFSEGGGYLYMSTAGDVVFRDRHSRIEDTRSASTQATFDDDGTDLPYHDILVANDDDLIKNLITAQRDGGIQQTATDSTSVGDYMTRSYNATVTLDNDIDVDNWCDWILALFKDFSSRVDAITLRPQRTDALWPVVLGSEFGDLMVVNRRPNTGNVVTKSVYLEGIDHSVTGLGGGNANPTGQWETKFRFASATAMLGLAGGFSGSSTWLRYDDGTVGKFDTGKFGVW